MKENIPYFMRYAEPFTADDPCLQKAIRVHINHFFSTIQIDDNLHSLDMMVDYDTENRYQLHLSELAGVLTKDEIRRIRRADKRYLTKYKEGIYKTVDHEINDNIRAFFAWLKSINTKGD